MYMVGPIVVLLVFFVLFFLFFFVVVVVVLTQALGAIEPSASISTPMGM